jgi:hypothetical protein
MVQIDRPEINAIVREGSSAAEADLLQRWPHLAKCGPEPHNQLGTLGEQLRKAFGPDGAPPWTRCADLCPPLSDEDRLAADALPPSFVRRLAATLLTRGGALRKAFLQLIADDVGEIAADVAREVMKRRRSRRCA